MKTFTISVNELFTVYYNVDAENEDDAKKTLQTHLDNYLKHGDSKINDRIEKTDHIFVSAIVNGDTEG